MVTDEQRQRRADYMRRWKRAHPDKVNRYNGQWRAKNLEEARAMARRGAHKRRARKTKAKGHYTRAQLDNRVALYGWRCAYCRGPYEEIDHVIPLSRGGSNWPANLRPACHHCNHSKKDKTLAEWRDGRPLVYYPTHGHKDP